jgi:DNA-binding SARP family transcriptional activator/tetratricopeptide (TPR) repeat protein/DNA-binding XRE family transcriptional regulator
VRYRVAEDSGESAQRLGGRLRQYRESAGLSQQQLAARAGLSVGAVRDLEQGRTARPRAQSVLRMARALGLGQRESDELAALRTASTHDEAGPGRQNAPAPGFPGAAPAPGLRLGVLGSLTAWRDGTPATLGTARQRAVLGLLAVQLTAGVHRDAIVDMLWGEDPPASAAAIVQSQVSALRRQLDPGWPAAPSDRKGATGAIIISDGARYRLRADVRSDSVEFAELAEQAETAAARGDLTAACELYASALRLWRGDALADVELLAGHPAVIGLAWDRAAAVMAYAAIAAAAGQPDRVLGQLRALAAGEPLNEKAHALLMTTLAAVGQRGTALEVYDHLSRRLRVELDVSPGAEVMAAYRKITREQTARLSEPHPQGPRQLPAAVPYFTGRTAELTALTTRADELAGAGGAAAISAISGPPGVGKTALAVHWAHQLADRFPDGQLHIDLGGFGPSGPPAAPAEAIRRLLDALGTPAGQIPASPDARAALYRSSLAGRKMLLILDNARDPAQVRPLLPHSPSCLVVVTSRQQLTGLAVAEGAQLLTLDVLDEAEASELLAGRLGGRRVAAEPAAARELTALCARLPLALSVAAARAAARPGLPLAALAAELRDQHARLDALGTHDAATDVRTVFSWSYQQVSDGAARMFRLIGLHPGPDLTVPAAASLAGLPPGHARQALAELTRAHLVTEPAPGRYTCHDLLRAYATEQARSHETDRSARASTQRVLDHYLHTAFAADGLLHTDRDLISLDPPAPQTRPESLADREQALAWFQAERQVLLAAVSQASGGGFHRHAWQLPWAVATFFSWQGYWHELDIMQHAALAAARHLDDLAGQAAACHYLAQAKIRVGAAAEGRALLRQALELGRRLGSSGIQARAHLYLAWACDLDGRGQDALHHTEQSLQLFRAAGNRRGEADALNAVGWCHEQLGAHADALDHCAQALEVFRELGNRPGEATTLDSLGYIQHQLGHYAEAIACYQQSIDVHGGTDLVTRTEVLVHLADSQQAAGDEAAARRTQAEALALLDQLNSPAAAQLREKLGQSAGPQRAGELSGPVVIAPRARVREQVGATAARAVPVLLNLPAYLVHAEVLVDEVAAPAPLLLIRGPEAAIPVRVCLEIAVRRFTAGDHLVNAVWTQADVADVLDVMIGSRAVKVNARNVLVKQVIGFAGPWRRSLRARPGERQAADQQAGHKNRGVHALAQFSHFLLAFEVIAGLR